MCRNPSSGYTFPKTVKFKPKPWRWCRVNFFFLIPSLINIFDEPFVFNQTYTIQIYHAGASKRPIATSINLSNPSENIPLNMQQTQTGDLEYI